MNLKESASLVVDQHLGTDVLGDTLIEETLLAWLLEDRISFLKIKHPEINSSHDILAKHRSASDIIDHLSSQHDPTKGKYTDHLVRWYKGGHFRQEDAPRMRELLTRFATHGRKLPVRDIGKYKSPGELSDALDSVAPKQVDVPKFKGLKQNEIDAINAGSELILDTPNVHVRKLQSKAKFNPLDLGHPDFENIEQHLAHVNKAEQVASQDQASRKAMQILGSGTKWCVVPDKHSAETLGFQTGSVKPEHIPKNTAFEEYSQEGPLYWIHDKRDNSRYLYHEPSDQFMDTKDRPASKLELPDEIKWTKGNKFMLDRVIHPELQQIDDSKSHTFVKKMMSHGSPKVQTAAFNHALTSSDDLHDFIVNEHDKVKKGQRKEYDFNRTAEQVIGHEKVHPRTLDYIAKNCSWNFISHKLREKKDSLSSETIEHMLSDHHQNDDFYAEMMTAKNFDPSILGGLITNHINKSRRSIAYLRKVLGKQVPSPEGKTKNAQNHNLAGAILNSKHVTPELANRYLTSGFKDLTKSTDRYDLHNYFNYPYPDLYSIVGSALIKTDPETRNQHLQTDIHEYTDMHRYKQALEDPTTTSETLNHVMNKRHEYFKDKDVRSNIENIILNHKNLNADTLHSFITSKEPVDVYDATQMHNAIGLKNLIKPETLEFAKAHHPSIYKDVYGNK